MKNTVYILSALIAAVLCFTGCSKSQPAQVDAAPLEKSFASADAGLKATAQKAIEAVKKGDLSAATVELQKLLADAKLTDEQKKAVTGVIEQVKQAIAALGSKAATDATKAFEDAQKSLSK